LTAATQVAPKNLHRFENIEITVFTLP